MASIVTQPISEEAIDLVDHVGVGATTPPCRSSS